MYRGVLVLLFIVSSFGAKAQAFSDLTLQDFKKGIFRYQNGLYEGGIITRTKKWQIEEYPSLNLKIKFRINWIGDFEYHLTPVAVSDPASEGMLGKIVKVKVLGVKDGVYQVLVQNGRKLEKVAIKMLAENPRDQSNFFAVMNSMKVKGDWASRN